MNVGLRNLVSVTFGKLLRNPTLEDIMRYKQKKIRKLRVNLKSLAAEARFIRKEERSVKKHNRYRLAKGEKLSYSDLLDFSSLQDHRTRVVREEARSTLLAYACLRGVPYNAVERKAKSEPDWHRVREKLDLRYYEGKPECEQWLIEAREHFLIH